MSVVTRASTPTPYLYFATAVCAATAAFAATAAAANRRPQMDRKWSAAHLLSSCRGLIFRAVKEPVLTSALNSTAYADGGQFDLNLSRSKV